jgi:imidazoleglycerol-phosphate dehydratase
MIPGKAEYARKTKETSVQVRLELYGQGELAVQTPFGFVDHLLTLLGFWAGFNMQLEAEGDVEVDAHHTLEDIGLCLGESLHQALGDKSHLARVGWARVPMDEALSDVVLDLSGRPYLVYRESVLPDTVFGQEKDVWREFFKALAQQARMNLHVHLAYGQNGHHLLESAFKALGLALRRAVHPEREGVLSTKGSLE